ncbi:uncharacterized protein LOC142232841 [Haematobia irritans]|uniref:uncharacterized protein LOC142232841 n=1 Tax=Haematobia irritans TaxID=7368 RepID=UPI003F509B4E
MFEKPPIWGIIVGLNVCVLIWFITVQEPVMYDASTSIISSGNTNNPHQTNIATTLQQQYAGGRDDREVREIPPSPSKLLYSSGRRHLSSNEVLGSTLSTHSNINNTLTESHNRVDDETLVKSTTSAIGISSPDIHALTSSLGTGVLKDKQKPTPSWIKTTAVSSALPDEDFTQLIDLHDFHYIVPQPVCNSEVEALILVHSAPRNHEKRQIIRETWASIGHHNIDTPFRVLFLLGSVDDQQLQRDIFQENILYDDIIQGSFVDDYRNMTYKHVMAFKWFLYNCPGAQILIKVDDDVYVNTPQLMKYLEGGLENQKPLEGREETKNPTIITIDDTKPKSMTTTKNSIFDSLKNYAISFTSSASELPSTVTHSTFKPSTELFHQPHNLLFCQKIIGSLVKRSYRSKWRVSFKEYSERYYPPYCPGYAIIYSPDVVFRLYTAAQKFKYFWIDDVHITGVLAQQTNTTITTSSHYVLYSDECERLLTGKTDLKDTEFLFAWHSISAQQIRAIWQLQIQSLPTPNDIQQQYSHRRRGRKKTRRRHPPQDIERLAYNITNYIEEPSEDFR